MNIWLDSRRNELFVVDLCLTSFTAAFAFVGMVASIFGMNLNSKIQTSVAGFYIVLIGGAVLILLSIGGFLAFLRLRFGVFRPEPRLPYSSAGPSG